MGLNDGTRGDRSEFGLRPANGRQLYEDYMIATVTKTLAALAGFTLVMFQVAPAIAINDMPDGFAFTVKARGIDGGRFAVEQHEENGYRVVDVTANLKFKLGFITLKKVEHQSREIWNGGRLIRLEAKTRKDGELIHISAEAQPDCLMVQASNFGQLQMPADTSPTSFTKPDLFDTNESKEFTLLDTLNGKARPSRLDFVDTVTRKIDGVATDLRYFRVHSREDGRLTYEFWIDDAGMAMEIFMHTDDGTTVKYTYAG